MDTKLAAKQVSLNTKKKTKLWRRNGKCRSHWVSLLHFFISFNIKILKHSTKLSVEHIYASSNLFHMLNTIYFKIFAWTLSLFSISFFLNYTLFFPVSGLSSPYSSTEDYNLFFFFFLSFHCLLLGTLFSCLADQVPLSSLKLKRKVNSILLNVVFWKFKGTWKRIRIWRSPIRSIIVGLIGMMLARPPGKSCLGPSQGKLSSVCIHPGRAAQGLTSLCHRCWEFGFSMKRRPAQAETLLLSTGDTTSAVLSCQ